MHYNLSSSLSNSMTLLLQQIEIQGEINKCLEIEKILTDFFEDDQHYFSLEKPATMLQTYLLSTLWALQEAKESNAKFIDELHQYLLAAGTQKLQ